MNEYLQKSLHHFKKIQPAECKAELEKLLSCQLYRLPIIDDLIVQNNLLACHILSILYDNTDQGNELIAERFKILLDKVQACPVNEESYQVQICVACNYVYWLLINDASSMESFLTCDRIWKSLIDDKKDWTYLVFLLLKNLIMIIYLIHGDLHKVEAMLKESKQMLDLQNYTKQKKYLPVLALYIICHPVDFTCCKDVQHFSNVIDDMHSLIKICFLTIKMKYDEAVATLQTIKTSEMSSLVGYLKIYLLFKTSNNSSSVIENAEILIKKKIDNNIKAQIQNIIGCCLSKQLKPNMAIKFFEASLQEDIAFDCPLYNIAVMYHSMKNTSAELEALSIFSLVNRDSHVKTSNLLVQILENSLEKLHIKSSVSVLAATYIYARRLLELKRFEEAANKYLDIISSMRNSEILQVKSTYYIHFPPIKSLYKEAAFALYMCGRYGDSITICHTVKLSNSEKITLLNKLKFDPSSDFKEFSSLPSEIQQVLINEEHTAFCKIGEQTKIDKSSFQNISLDEILLWMIESYALLKFSQFSEGIKIINRILICLYDLTIEQNIKKCKTVSDVKFQCDSSKQFGLAVKEEQDSGDNMDSLFIDQLKAHAYNCQALFLIQQGCLNDALHNLRLACQLYPDNLDFQYNFTLLLIKLNRKEEAFHSWIQFRNAYKDSSKRLFSTVTAAEEDTLDSVSSDYFNKR